ncbi:MAG: ice-binding family protein [Sphaerochaeta sp.]
MNKIFLLLCMVSLLFTVTLLGCSDAQNANPSDIPRVTSSSPSDSETAVPLNRNVSLSFSEEMDESTLNGTTFTVKQGSAIVDGAVEYSNMTVVFTPTLDFNPNSEYLINVSLGAKDMTGNSMTSVYTGSFTTGTSIALGPKPVALGTSGDFVILSKSGVSTEPTSAITGDVGTSPIGATALTGFSLIADATNMFSTSAQVTGRLYASNYAVPTPAKLTSAVSNMELAYTDAAGRINAVAENHNIGAGEIGGLTLSPGLYTWGTGVTISNDVTLEGGAYDVWIFQVAQGVTVAPGKKIVLSGGALAKNIFWQSAGVVSLGTTSHMEGIVLSNTSITLNTGASVNGRLLAQTVVTLDASTVSQPAL